MRDVQGHVDHARTKPGVDAVLHEIIRNRVAQQVVRIAEGDDLSAGDDPTFMQRAVGRAVGGDLAADRDRQKACLQQRQLVGCRRLLRIADPQRRLAGNRNVIVKR